MLDDIEILMEWLLNYRKEHTDFRFKGRTTEENKLKKKFWFNGNENYYFIKFSNRGTPNSFTTISYRFWYKKNRMTHFDFFICYNNELDYRKNVWNNLVREQKFRLVKCITFLDENSDRLGLIPSNNYNANTWGSKSYRFTLAGNIIKDTIINQSIHKLEYFIQSIKPDLDIILNRNLIDDNVKDELFISERNFRNYLNILENYRPGSKLQAGL